MGRVYTNLEPTFMTISVSNRPPAPALAALGVPKKAERKNSHCNGEVPLEILGQSWVSRSITRVRATADSEITQPPPVPLRHLVLDVGRRLPRGGNISSYGNERHLFGWNSHSPLYLKIASFPLLSGVMICVLQ